MQPTETHTPAVTSDLGHTIFFPRQGKTEGERAVMEALIGGTLVLADDCIRVHNDEVGINYLLIWSPDFNLTIENGVINILDGNGEIVAHIGDTVTISGGGNSFTIGFG